MIGLVEFLKVMLCTAPQWKILGAFSLPINNSVSGDPLNVAHVI